MAEQHFDGSARVREFFKIQAQVIVDIKLAVLPEFENRHGGKGFRHRGQVEGIVFTELALATLEVAIALIPLTDDGTVFGHQVSAIETLSTEIFLEKTPYWRPGIFRWSTGRHIERRPELF